MTALHQNYPRSGCAYYSAKLGCIARGIGKPYPCAMINCPQCGAKLRPATKRLEK